MPAFNHERAARILVEAAYKGDSHACQAYHITERTLRNWRQRLDVDAHFSAIFHEKKQLFERSWADELPAAIRATIEAAKRAAQQLDAADPDGAHAIAGLLKILSEIATMREILDARLTGTAGKDHPQD